ncbi:hypothetical protein EV426DRAFT_570829 [Tirmania nivea]|nr:hypothetical protein EV426DRAFT_570829 [Tirmania nivea]
MYGNPPPQQCPPPPNGNFPPKGPPQRVVSHKNGGPPRQGFQRQGPPPLVGIMVGFSRMAEVGSSMTGIKTAGNNTGMGMDASTAEDARPGEPNAAKEYGYACKRK